MAPRSHLPTDIPFAPDICEKWSRVCVICRELNNMLGGFWSNMGPRSHLSTDIPLAHL